VAPWKSTGEELARAKRDATLLALKAQRMPASTSSRGRAGRQAFRHGFWKRSRASISPQVEMGIRKDRYKAMVPQVCAAAAQGRVHADEARVAAPHCAQAENSPCPAR